MATLFISYSHRDEALRSELEIHLAMLKREGTIEVWHDRRIVAGQELDATISENLESADVILLLISADFLASRYCYDVEVQRAMQRHAERTAQVIPVILRPCDWQQAPFAKILAAPTDAKPITKWADRDDALLDVTKHIRAAVVKTVRIAKQPEQAHAPAVPQRPVVPSVHAVDEARATGAGKLKWFLAAIVLLAAVAAVIHFNPKPEDPDVRHPAKTLTPDTSDQRAERTTIVPVSTPTTTRIDPVSLTPEPPTSAPTSLLTDGSLIWDAKSKLAWAVNIFEFGTTEQLFESSNKGRSTKSQDLAAVQERARRLSISGTSDWRIANAVEIETLKSFDGSAIFRGFSRHRIRTGATNVMAIHRSSDGGLGLWGYQHANFLQGPHTVGDYSINEFGVWLVAGPMDNPIAAGASRAIRSSPETPSETTFSPLVAATMRKEGSNEIVSTENIARATAAKDQIEVRSVFHYNLGSLTPGALVRGEIVLEPLGSAGTGEVAFTIYQTDGLLRPSETGDWAPTPAGSAKHDEVTWDGRNRSRLTLPQHLMRNAAAQRGLFALHGRHLGGGTITFKPPQLILTYIKNEDLLISR